MQIDKGRQKIGRLFFLPSSKAMSYIRKTDFIKKNVYEKKVDRQTARQIDRQKGRQIDRKVDRQTERQIYTRTQKGRR